MSNIDKSLLFLSSILFISLAALNLDPSIVFKHLNSETIGQPIATIKHIEGNAHLKSKKIFSWISLKQDDDIRPLDKILTDGSSKVSVHFLNGSSINILENSLVQITESIDSPLSIEAGTVIAKVGKNEKLAFTNQGKIIELASSSNEVRIEKANNGHLNMSSDKEFKADIDGKTQITKTSEQLEVGKNKIFKKMYSNEVIVIKSKENDPYKKEIRIRTINPLSDSEKLEFSKHRNFDRKINGAYKKEGNEYVIPLVSDTRFLRIRDGNKIITSAITIPALQKVPVKTSERSLASQMKSLDSIKIKDLLSDYSDEPNQNTIETPQESLTLEISKALSIPTLVFPLNRTTILANKSQNKAVHVFSWNPNGSPSEFEFQLATTPDFLSPYNNVTAESNFITVGQLKKGVSFWRVRSLSDGKASEWSKIQKVILQ